MKLSSNFTNFLNSSLGRPQCENLLKTDSLLMECSDEFYINSYCRFDCPSEFTFVGNKVLKCTNDNLGSVSWNGTIPECKSKLNQYLFVFHSELLSK